MNAKISDTSASNDEKPEIFSKSWKGMDHFFSPFTSYLASKYNSCTESAM